MDNSQLILAGLQEYVNRVKRYVNGLISIAVISTQNGEIMAYDSMDPSVDNRLSGKYQVGVIRSAATALEAYNGVKNKDISDITINYDGQKHLLLLSESRKFMSHAIMNKNANQMLIKKIMLKHITELTQELANRFGSRDFAKQVDIKL